MIDSIAFLDRECRVIADTEQGNSNYLEQEQKLSIEELASEPAFVLLGEPGMGKTSSFRALAGHFKGQYITAQNFTLEDISSLDADKFYCIDALDEARVQAGSTTLNEIRKLISQAKLSRFCIACRIADWFKTDAEDIKHVAPAKKLKVAELLPLSEEQASKLLATTGVQDPDDFMDQAQQLGFADMLGNPQSLKMLAAAVKQNNQQWPTKRSDAYELASISLLQEHNDRHSHIGSESLTSDESLLGASGWLCSIMLLSNLAAISNSESSDEESFDNIVYLKSIIQDFPNEPSTVSKVLKRRLFQKTGNAYNYSPIHRTMAEYLAARYLAKLIGENELLAGRISTLILASSHHIISNLRGLAGWLAALSPAMRQKVFSADPAAVIDYGDLYLLPSSDKQQLVQSLATSSSFNYSQYRRKQGERYAPLVHAEMQDFIIAWLNKFIQDLNQFKTLFENSPKVLTVEILLYALKEHTKEALWEQSLDRIVRHKRIPRSVRLIALSALWQHSLDSVQSLLSLLNDIYNGKVQDQGKTITGDIFNKLYPKHISPKQILRCFKSPDKYNFKTHNLYWILDLNGKTPDDLLLEWMKSLEESLVNGTFEPDTDGQFYNQRDEFSPIILRSIETFGAEQTPKRLEQWLSWCVFDNATPFGSLDSEELQRLSQWQELNFSKIQEVIAYRLKTTDDPYWAIHKVSSGLDLPRMGAFWLAQARLMLIDKDTSDFSKRSAVALDNAFSHWMNNDAPKISLEDIEKSSKLHPDLKEIYDDRRKSDIEGNWQRKSWLSRKDRRLKEKQDKQNNTNRFALLLEQLDIIRTGDHLQFLYYAAWAESYNNRINNSEHNRILQQLEEHLELRKATDEGYIACLKNLTKQHIAKAEKAQERKQSLLLELPAYIAAERLFKLNPTEFYRLNNEVLEVVSTLFLRYSIDNIPEWLLDLSEKKPDIIRRAWWEAYKGAIKVSPKQQEKIRQPFLRTLYTEPRLIGLAKELLPKALKHWPLKVNSNNMDAFAELLIAMIQCCPEALPELLNNRLQRKTISAAQKAQLIMTGVWAAPSQFANKLKPLLKQKITARNSYLSFITYVNRYGTADSNSLAFSSWDLRTKALLFELFAPLFPPYPPERTEWVSNTHDDGRHFLRELSEGLFNNLENDGLQSLKDLKSDPALELWENRLDDLINQYAKALAEQGFTIPTPIQVVGVLQNKAPANHADLMAVTLEALEQLQIEIKNSPTNLINRFWSLDSNAQKAIPPHRPEEECRNVIADCLAAKLQPKGITLFPELLHGAGNRSDIGLLVQNKNQPDLLLPIEVKGDWNDSKKGGRDLWHAAKNQLYNKYVMDSRCGPFGLYLVLWLGSRKKGIGGHKDEVYLHPNYKDLTSADQLLQALTEETKKQMGDTAKQIEIVVLDLSTT